MNDAESAAAVAVAPAARHWLVRGRARNQVRTAALDGKQPDRRRHRRQRVAGRGRRPGELAEHRCQGVKHRRVVKHRVCLDVAQLAHVGRRRLAGVEDEAHRVGVPDRVPGAGNGLPVREAAPCRPSDQQRAQQHPGRHRHRRPAADRAGLACGVAIAGERNMATRDQHAHHGQCGQRRPTVPQYSDRAQGNDRQRNHAVRQRRTNRDSDRPR